VPLLRSVMRTQPPSAVPEGVRTFWVCEASSGNSIGPSDAVQPIFPNWNVLMRPATRLAGLIQGPSSVIG
jgi:hypothetical protein